jgi:uncharacterized repeat protein (TIGR01451 family)
MDNTTKNYFHSTERATTTKWVGLALVLTAIFVSVFAAGTALACANGSTLSLQEFITDRNAGAIHGDVSLSGGTAHGTVTNNTECAMTATLASFNKMDGSYANQTTYQQMTVTVPAHSSANASVTIPSCSSQIDLYYGTYYSHSANGIDLMDLAYTHNDGPFCTTPVPDPTLAVSCSGLPNSVNLGSPVTWSATATGGTGSYVYSWVGTDGFSASGISTSKTYSNAGSKVATVRVTSGGQSATNNCSAMVNTPVSNLVATCLASPSSIQANSQATFTANVSGGTGGYTYSWSGACTGLISTCINTFPTPGTQVATLNVTSGNQTVTANCPVVVGSNPVYVTCLANPTSITSGQATTFIASASGGTGAYTYSWSGACSGVGLTCNNNIYSSGTQTATVTVTSGSQTNSATCYVNAGQSCTPNYQQRCVGTSMYWYDSCGAQGNYVGSCGNTCTPNFQQRCVGTSMYWYDSCGAQGSYVGSCGQTYTNASLTMTKTVRDLTTGTSFSSSTYANPSDMLMYMITLQAGGNQDVQNVVIRDTLPNNIIYNNHLVVARNNNSYNNYSGDIVYGLNLNTISSGQTVTVTYQAQVASAANFQFGTTTLNNLVSATASNASVPTATASAIITKSTVLGASTVSTGLTNNFWVDSFFLPLLIALIGIWMLRAGVFFGVEKWFDDRKKTRRGYKAEKELSSRIETIKKFGK